MAKKLFHIGTIELVSLPDDMVEGIPAKIDTGADNSAIWASNVHLEKGKLVFNLFAPGSAYYREQAVVSTAFRTATVRNSFGHKEFRYKIKLKVQIGDHTLTRWFSLADRSRNTYPVLLGKNFLKGKFVVDVSRKYEVSKGVAPNKVIIIGAYAKPSKEFFERVGKLSKLSLQYSCVGYDQLMYYIDGKQNTKVLGKDNEDIASYTYAYFKTHTKHSEFAAAAAEYLQFKGRPFVDREPLRYVSASKLSENMKLACYDLPVPPGICAVTNLMLKSYGGITKQLGSPFVLKEISSNRGRNNYLIANQTQFKELLKAAPASHVYLAQRFIPNEGYYRIYVLGKELGLAIWRSSYKRSDKLLKHLDKPVAKEDVSRLETAQLVRVEDLPAEVQQLALRAAHTMERQIAGVDILQDKLSKKWYILEVNNAPQIRSGLFVDEKVEVIARFFDKELNR